MTFDGTVRPILFSEDQRFGFHLAAAQNRPPLQGHARPCYARLRAISVAQRREPAVHRRALYALMRGVPCQRIYDGRVKRSSEAVEPLAAPDGLPDEAFREIKKAGVPDPRKQLRERDGLFAGARGPPTNDQGKKAGQ